MADGKTPEEAAQAAQTAIRLWIEGARKTCRESFGYAQGKLRRTMGRPIPQPAQVRDAALKPLLTTVG
jgi:hypothetical protein